MTAPVDLLRLAQRESEQVEWKASVADVNDVVKTLSAFANDLPNLGGGYVVCGASEEKDEHGFQRLVQSGLAANRFKEVEGDVMTRCRTLVAPPITPIVTELPGSSPGRRLLIFTQPATAHAHAFRSNDGAAHYVRISRETRAARDGVLLDLLVRKAAIPSWDHRPCERATVDDLDLLALREALVRLRMFDRERGVEPLLVPDAQLHALVPSLCVAEPLTGTIRPRNYAILLFGKQPQKFIPGSFSQFSLYPGRDRSEPRAERHELAGTVLDQAKRLTALVEAQASMLFDKEDLRHPNKVRYPIRALMEALSNTLAHRNYELYDPVRITAFVDRIEFVSPGALPLGTDLTEFRQGLVGPRWRNQVLAWFFNRLDLAQAEGQGIQAMRAAMVGAGCPEPQFEANEVRVACTLGVNPVALQVEAETRAHASSPATRQRAAQAVLILAAITRAGDAGISRRALASLVPTITAHQLRGLLRGLQREGQISSRGARAAARWYPGPEPEGG